MSGLLLVDFITLHAQPLTRADRSIGGLQLDMPFDSVLTRLGDPAGPHLVGIPATYEGYRYPGLVVWRDTLLNTLCGLDLLDAALQTRRGLKVGDPLERASQLYGKPLWAGTHFDEVGPYKYPIPRNDLTWEFETGDYHLIVVAKDAKIVRLSLYRHLSMDTEDFSGGPAKLGASAATVQTLLGKPDSISFADTLNSFSGLYYPGLLVWRSNSDKSIGAFEMLAPKYTTHRGLRVGDSIDMFRALYGTYYYEMAEFDRVGVYDQTFKDYDYACIIEGYMVCYIKNDCVARILFYVGVDE